MRPLAPKLSLMLASTNEGKISELRGMLPKAIVLRTLKDFPHLPEVIEDADTFEGNAEKKALACANATGLISLADDSGLCVDALDGRPGVQSARYAETNELRIGRLLRELEGVPPSNRTARFVCVFCLVVPGTTPQFSRGECEGVIALTPIGQGGFGFDPVFQLPDGRSMAQLSPSEKAAVSHRGEAFRNLAMFF
jgi:XTP/dITP diphosphohydrolase